tara:strand:- start:137 stop:607 length:471 start_codon:yes stop_codon:yes gene_type:complete
METILKITNDYESNFSYQIYREGLVELSNDLDIVVQNTNREMMNILEHKDTNVDGYVQSIQIECKGYSQSDWDTYTIHYNQMTADLEILIEELSRVFTHKHDYFIQEVEVLDSGHELVVDQHTIFINHIEFPTKLDILEQIESNGIEYDKLKFNLN